MQNQSNTVKDFINANTNLAWIYSLASDPIVEAQEVEAYIKGAATSFNDAELSIMLRVMSIVDSNPDKSIQYCIGFAVFKYLSK